jgi:cell division protein FtsI/penicillin-binding protein 2
MGAISAIANDGIYMRPFVVKYVKDAQGQIIYQRDPQALDKIIKVTSRRMKAILKGVVDEGTGTKAAIKGVTVAGKTGTAQKVVGGSYSHSHFYATFAGFAPVENPRLACVVVFDDPHPAYYAATVAAPVFSEVVGDALKYLNTQRQPATDDDSPG